MTKLRPIKQSKLASALYLLCLAGCASPKALKIDHDEYSKVYAEANNKQLLLNLARLSNEEPVYFIQLGSISSQYQFTSSIGASPTYVFRHTPATLGGTVSAGLNQTPIFQFVPLTGTNLVQAILTPITDKVFMTFFDQGYPADLVLRTMVASVEHKIGNGDNSEFWLNDPNDPTYEKFLMFCANARNAQLSQTLILDPTSTTNVVVYDSDKAKLPDVVSTVQAPGFSVTCDTNSSKVLVSYSQKNLRWRMNPLPGYGTNSGTYKLEHESDFLQDTNLIAVLTRTRKPAGYAFDNRTAQEKATGPMEFASYVVQTNIALKMRTFEAAMYSVARQQVYFERHKDETWGNIFYCHDDYGPFASLSNHNIVVRPAMTLKYSDIRNKPDHELVHVDHESAKFSVADYKGSDQNSAVFTMLSYLYAQTSINTQNLPVQQTIRLQ